MRDALRYARRMRGGLLLTFLLRALIAGALISAAWWPGLDVGAEAQVEAGLKRALLAFAMARGLNGVISVAQGTEVAIQPAGVGVKLAPGELLDPVNDLIEQFSTVMLFASASLGLQRLLIGMSGWAPLTLALTAFGIAWLVFATVQSRRRAHHAHVATATARDIVLHESLPRSRFVSFLQGVFIVLLALRLSVPAASIASEGAYQLFLAPEYEQSRAELESAREKIARAGRTVSAHQTPAPDAGFVDRARQWFDKAGETLDVEARLEALQETAAAVTRNVIDLIAIFVVQTVILPLLFLWLGWLALTRGLPKLWAATRSG